MINMAIIGTAIWLAGKLGGAGGDSAGVSS
jgi:hypothetical protein